MLNLSFSHWLVILSVFVSIFGSFFYIKNTIKGITKPNRVSWFMWAVIPILSAIIVITTHANIWATVRVFLAGLIPLMVFIASFLNPKSYWKLEIFDLVCGALAIFALVIWLVIGFPNLAVLFLVLADGLAALPTIVKAWKYPETETATTYLAGLISVILVIPSIPIWDIKNSAFQIYLIIANSILFFAVYRKKLGVE